MRDSLFTQIFKSATIDDLDDAVRPIQEVLGVYNGAYADIFFDGERGEVWGTATFELRQLILRSYIVAELQMLHLRVMRDIEG